MIYRENNHLTLVKQIIEHGRSLSSADAEYLFDYFLQKPELAYQLVAVLAVMKARGETKDELIGLCRVISRRMQEISLDITGAIDIGGTGGDGYGTFNISTTTAFIVAASGVRVCKHGNNRVSSHSGSIDVLSALGFNVEALSSPACAKILYETFGITFLSTKSYHDHPQFLVDLRTNLAISTAFNTIGPILNPAHVPFQIIGVARQKLMEPMSHVLMEQGREGFMLVHGMEGIDEVSPCGPTSVIEYRKGILRSYLLHPNDFGLEPINPRMLMGGTPTQNAVILEGILTNECMERLGAVLPSAATALYLSGAADNFAQGVQIATDTVTSGKAAELLMKLRGFFK